MNNNLSIKLALQNGEHIAYYSSIFCPRVGEIIRLDYVYRERCKEYKVLAVYHNVANGTQFHAYVVVEDISE